MLGRDISLQAPPWPPGRRVNSPGVSSVQRTVASLTAAADVSSTLHRSPAETELPVSPLLQAGPLPTCTSYSQAAGFVEGTGLVQWIWGLVSWGDLQVAGDIDLEGKIKPTSKVKFVHMEQHSF